jgi:hypothetical protein
VHCHWLGNHHWGWQPCQGSPEGEAYQNIKYSTLNFTFLTISLKKNPKLSVMISMNIFDTYTFPGGCSRCDWRWLP